MTDESREADLKALWRAQEPEGDAMKLEQIHARAREFDRKGRAVMSVWVLIVAAFAFMAGQAWLTVRNAEVRASLILGLAGMLLSAWIVSRLLFPHRDPGEPAALYLRRRIAASIDNRRRLLPLTLLPMLPGIAMGIYALVGAVPGSLVKRAFPVLLLVAATAFVMLRSRLSVNKVSRELREIDELMKG